jgi:hypothetical protein
MQAPGKEGVPRETGTAPGTDGSQEALLSPAATAGFQFPR